MTALEHLIANVDSDCLLASKSGYHSAKHLRETVLQITKDLTDEKVFDLQPGGRYQCFKKFKVDFLSKLDHREFFKWGRCLFKVWEPICIIQHKKTSVFFENVTEFLNHSFTPMMYVRVL